MSQLGVELEALRRFAAGLNRRSHEISALTTRLTGVIDAVPWVGPDREAFVAKWHQDHQPSLMDLCHDLTESAGVALRNAAAQEEASRAQGGGGAGW